MSIPDYGPEKEPDNFELYAGELAEEIRAKHERLDAQAEAVNNGTYTREIDEAIGYDPELMS